MSQAFPRYACTSLAELPDGQWFCEECKVRRKSNQVKPKAAPSREQRGVDAPTSSSGRLPFGRVELDEAKLKKLEETIQILRDLRPERQKQTVNGELLQGSDNDETSNDEFSAIKKDG